MVTVLFPFEITTPNKRYSPVGKCIYCGSTHKLSEEHIVPFGIAGDAVVLPKASCKACTDTTGRYELKILRHMIGNLRIKIGAPTRNPKERPSTVPFRKGRWDGSEITQTQTVTIDASTAPFFYPALKFPWIGLLAGRDPDQQVSYDVTPLHIVEELKSALGTSHNAFQSELIYPFEFAQMIAKIAHSYAVAELGVDGFEPFLNDLIRGELPYQINRALHWVGCEPAIAPSSADIFALAWNKFVRVDNMDRPLIVTVRLFPCFPTPTYQVLVGKW